METKPLSQSTALQSFRFSIVNPLGLLLFLLLVSFARAETATLAPGIMLETETRTAPRPLRLHWITADLDTPGVALVFSPVDPASAQPAKATAAKPTDLLRQLRWNALINGDAFFVLGDEKKRYPSEGDTLVLQGYSVIEGKRRGQRSANNGTFYLLDDRKTMGVTYDAPPKNTWGAIGGYRIVLQRGNLGGCIDTTRLHPRTVIGFNNTTHKVYFLVVDGRQSGRSEGANENELGEWMRDRGATDALSLDGGGSSVLVIEQDGGARVVNRPVGVYDQPGTVRCIGNAVGLQASAPLNPAK